MTLALTDGREEYAGNGVTVDFSFPHYFLEDEDLVVIERVNATGVETLKTLTTHYTVVGERVQAGGTVTMLVAPATGTTLVIYRDPEAVQDVDYENNQVQSAATQERALDKQMMIAQRLQNRLDRSVRLSEGFSSSFDPALPALLEPGQTIIVNEDGDGFEAGPTAEDIADAEASALAAADSADAAADSATDASNFADAAEAAEAAAESSAEDAANAVITVQGYLGGGAIPETSFLLPNTTGVSDVDGLVFDKNLYKGAMIRANVRRKTDSEERIAIGYLKVYYLDSTSTWELLDELGGNIDDGVTFSITAAGQVKYTTDNQAGANYSGSLHFAALTFDA